MDMPQAQIIEQEIHDLSGLLSDLSVSYTHLDVYKRQLHEWPIECQYPGLCRFLHERTPLRETNRSVEHLMEILHHT